MWLFYKFWLSKNELLEEFYKVHVYSSIFTHIQTYPDIFRHIKTYSGIFWHMYNSRIFKTLVYSELWHIQNQKHIQNSGISKTLTHLEPETYSESWNTQNWRHTSRMEHFEKQLKTKIILSSQNYFHNVSFSCPLVHEIDMIF